MKKKLLPLTFFVGGILTFIINKKYFGAYSDDPSAGSLVLYALTGIMLIGGFITLLQRRQS